MADAMRLMNIQPDHFEEGGDKSKKAKDLKQSVWTAKQNNNNSLAAAGRG
jgi:hypothetical protein